jgi:biopolymer transport protein ExbD
MRNRRLVYAPQRPTQDINVSPLIDIVFILLIFFIVTTVFVNKETGVEVRRPQAAASADLAHEALYFAVTDDGRVMYGGADIGVHGVRGVVGRQLRETPDLPVIIQADRAVSVDLYVQVHDAALAAGAVQVQLATRKEQP